MLLSLALLLAIPAGAAPLSPARVTEQRGSAFRGAPATGATGVLRMGDAAGERVRTGPDPGTLLELTFADGSLLRLGPSSDISIDAAERRVSLRAGRLLVHADRMIGGVQVMTRSLVLFPEGTTYLVEITPPSTTRVIVLEGAVRVTRPEPPPQYAVVLPGEILQVDAAQPFDRPAPQSIHKALGEEPLIRAFTRPLPSHKRMIDLLDQQRRGILAGRNERLRKELYWRRPKLPPIILPELFRD
jgi:ferric-dicitrate binding protein FerR (iron transport regulator)